VAPRPVVLYPDPRLRQKALPVEDWNETLRALAQDILDAMEAHAAVGLTAVHVGVASRLMAIRLEPGSEPRLYANPEILSTSPESAEHTEGSVSMPGVTETVERPATVRIRYQDLSGAVHEEEAHGFLAACILHEIDQLDGIFWLERLSRLKRERIIKRYGKLRRTTAT
jgi:peptide deformylase